MLGHLAPSWLPHHMLPCRREFFQSHPPPGKRGSRRGTPGPSCKTWARGPGVCARVGCVVHPTHSQSLTRLGKPSPSFARGGGTGQLPPLRIWRAARRLSLVLHGVDGLLITEPTGTGRSGHRVCISKGTGRLGNLLSCHCRGDTGFTENNFLLIKWGMLNITHTYNF